MRFFIEGFVDHEKKQLLIEEGKIADIGYFGSGSLTGAKLIQTNGTILPGFVDVHVHGGGGADTMDASEEAFEQIAVTHAKHGTTALLLTTITESEEATERALAAFDPHKKRNGAEIIGFHLEGPFIHPGKPGAQPKEYIQPPNVDLLRRWMAISQGTVRYMTVAPDVQGAEALVREARRMGVVVSAGHTSTSYEQALTSFDWGIQSVTHLYNAMTGLHHRNPGLVGAAFDREEVYAELIADNIHVHQAAMKIAMRIKGTNRMMLITDAISAACMAEGGAYSLGGHPVTVQNGTVRLMDGTIAGSVLTIDKAVRNLMTAGIIGEGDISSVTTLNQSRLLGLPYGRIEKGTPANIVVMDDHFQVTHTFVRGNLVFQQ